MGRYQVSREHHAGGLGVFAKGDVVELTDAQAAHFASTQPGLLAPAPDKKPAKRAKFAAVSGA